MAVKTNKIFCLEMVHLKDIFKKERKLYGKYSWQIHIILGKNAKYSSPKAFTIATLKLHRLNFLPYNALKAYRKIMLFVKLSCWVLLRKMASSKSSCKIESPKLYNTNIKEQWKLLLSKLASAIFWTIFY